MMIAFHFQPSLKESLDDLDKSLKKKNSRLFYFYDEPHTCISKLIKKLKVQL